MNTDHLRPLCPIGGRPKGPAPSAASGRLLSDHDWAKAGPATDIEEEASHELER
jgi:hypothetical protein